VLDVVKRPDAEDGPDTVEGNGFAAASKPSPGNDLGY
jgi:hypothetical protein